MITTALHGFLFNPDFDNALLMRSNYMVWSILLSYILFVKRFGPAVMKNRKPLNLQYTIIAFNSALVFCNVYLSFTIGQYCWRLWSERCHLKHNPDIVEQKEFLCLAWQVLLLKIAELFDTVFFILRKKFNQASFLHVFHHSVIVLLYWSVMKKKDFGYYLVLAGHLNCGVHVLTYLYYGMSAIGPSVRKYLWWKKYLTIIQILQFFFFMIYMGYSFVTDCDEFGFFEKSSFTVTAIVCVLFFNFYFKAYRKKQQNKAI